MPQRKYQKTYVVWYYPDSPKDEDGVPYNDLLEIWGNYTATSREEAIEAALEERYGANGVDILLAQFNDRGRDIDRPDVFARLHIPLLPLSNEEPMKSRQKAESAFYKTIGELQERVMGNPEGLVLDGPFTPAELRLVADAFDQYQETLKALESK